MTRRYEHHKVWMNGKVVAPQDATVSVFTATAMRGANIYEGIRAYWSPPQSNLFVWKLDLHIDRLFRNMRVMRMTPPMSRDAYKSAVIEWARANDFREDVHCRLVTYFGDGGSGDVKQFSPEEIEIGVWIHGGPRPHGGPRANPDGGINVCVSSWRRINDDSMPARVKAGSNYQNSRFAAVEARVNGYDDALILTRDGKLAEAPSSNAMIVRNGKLISPAVTQGILEGITRATLLDMYRLQTGQPAIEREIDRSELYVADEILLCGSAEEVTAVVAVDRIAIGDGTPGPVTRALRATYLRAVRGQDPAYAEALTPVY